MEKIAVIDIGSNSARMVFAHILESGHFVVFDEIKETIRLGQNFETDGMLKRSRVDHAVKILKMFRKMCDSHGIDRVYCIATNAIRVAKNQKSFLEEINAVCGFRVRVLTEDDEAHYIYQGVINSLEINKGLIVDISGSTMQFIYYNRRSILHTVSLPFGSISLMEMVENDDIPPHEKALKIENFVKLHLSKIEWLKQIDPDVSLIGVGGSMRNIGHISMRIAKYPLENIHNYAVSRTDFCSIYDMVKVLDTSKLTTIKGLSSERSDIFCSALAAIKAVFDSTAFKGLVISSSGLREGIMYYHSMPTIIDKPISDILSHSISGKIVYSGGDKSHLEQVHNIALLLYKQLRVLHKLPRYYVRVFRIAALLYESGKKVRYYNYTKNTLNFILNSGIMGASHREIVLAAFVADAYKNDEFDFVAYKRYASIVLPEDLSAVYKLGVMLKIATQLDRSRTSCITDIKCDILGESVIMKTTQVGDCALELRQAMNTAPEFAKAFKKNLEII